ATPPTAVAELAGAPAIERLGQMGYPADSDITAREGTFDAIACVQFETIELHGFEELPVRQMWNTPLLTADAHEFFYIVIPGSNIPVANRPVYGNPFFGVGLKIQIAPAVA